MNNIFNCKNISNIKPSVATLTSDSTTYKSDITLVLESIRKYIKVQKIYTIM